MAKTNPLSRKLIAQFFPYFSNLSDKAKFRHGLLLCDSWSALADIRAETGEGWLSLGVNKFGNQLSATFNHPQYGFSVYDRSPTALLERLHFEAMSAYSNCFAERTMDANGDVAEITDENDNYLATLPLAEDDF